MITAVLCSSKCILEHKEMDHLCMELGWSINEMCKREVPAKFSLSNDQLVIP